MQSTTSKSIHRVVLRNSSWKWAFRSGRPMTYIKDWSGKWRRAMGKNVWTGAVKYAVSGGPQRRRTCHEIDRSIFTTCTTSNRTWHVRSTHCNAVAVDAAVDVGHVLAI